MMNAEAVSTASRADVYRAINDLVEQRRGRCLWFVPRDYMPATDPERLAALDHIERYGDREAFVQARRLRDWLLHNSSEK